MKFLKRTDRTFEDMVRRLLNPNESLSASFARARPIDEKARKTRKAFVPPHYGELARKIGMKADTFYSKLDGQSKFWAHEAKAILSEVHDIELVDYFLADTPFIASHRIDRGAPGGGVFERLVDNALLHVTELRVLADKTLEDNKLTHDERDALFRKLLELETAVVAVRNQFEDTPDTDRQTQPHAVATDY